MEFLKFATRDPVLLCMWAGISLVLGAASFREPSGWVSAVFIVLGVLLLVVAGLRLLSKRSERPERPERYDAEPSVVALFRDQVHPPKVQNFCRDCGAQFTTHRTQNGFDPDTGDPKYDFRRQCSNYDTALGKRMSMAGKGHVSASFLMGPGTWPNCGERKNARVDPHNHDRTIVEVTADCPACIDQMLRDHIITDQIASDLLRKAGISH